MNLSITVFVILFLAISTEAFRHHGYLKSYHHKSPHVLDNSNPSAGYIFMGEQSICSCRENIVYLNFIQYLANYTIPYGCNGYGIRQFGDKAFNDTNLLEGYGSRDRLVWKANNWLGDDINDNCRYSDNVTYQSALLDILIYLQGNGLQSYLENAIFIQGETDTIVDLDVSLAIANQIASYHAIIYIWDHSKYGDQTGLFSILTNNIPGRIIYSNASLVELVNIAKNGNLFSDFASIGCGNFSSTPPPPPSEPALVTEPGYCPNIMPKYTTTSAQPTSTTTTTTVRPTTTTTSTTTTTTATTTTTRPSTQPPTTTTTTTTRLPTTTTSIATNPPPSTTTHSYPTSNGTCYKIIFAGEMSGLITLQQKQIFYNNVLQISAHLPNDRLQFSIITYGINLYPTKLEFQPYKNFVNTVNQLIEQLPYPNSSWTMVQKAYDEILDAIQANPNQKMAALVMGQMEAIKDPQAGYTAALKIAATGTNVYVLDYSKGTIPMSIYPYLTNHHLERIINGTGKSSDDIYSAFQKTMINDVVNNHC